MNMLNNVMELKGKNMGKKILIVDDSSLIRRIVSKTAKSANYEVVSACDGQEALDELQKNSDVDLILSDINMPVMDGFEMIKRIKNEDNIKYIPIVILSTESKASLKQQARDLGVKAWMVKPFDEKTFLKAMMKLIG